MIMLLVTYVTGRNGYMLMDMAFWGEINNPLINLAEVLEYQGICEFMILPLKVIFMITFIGIRCTIGSLHVFEI